MSEVLRALVTNDDGIASEGLRRLASLAVDAGLDVVVAAPNRDTSGASASLTAVQAGGRVVLEHRELDGLEGVPAYGLEAVPAFITLIATRGAFGEPPDVVLSGINNGHNAGQAVLHSGTVGAAMTGATQGCRAMAVSAAAAEAPHWDTAVDAARTVLPWLLDAPPRTVLNLNAPGVPALRLRGLRRARLASFGAVQTNIAEVGEDYVRVQIVDMDAEREPDTDAALLTEAWATLTALQPICEGSYPPLDMLLPAAHRAG
jgi:5'-nucleotidase